MTVRFVGAGPGDPELITVKGQRLLAAADTIIYAGSLVNPALLCLAKQDAVIMNSASMTLDEVIDAIVRATGEGREVVRLHTGDPSIYGAIKEQMDALDKRGIPYEVVPGVSSFLAAAAALRCEYTLPEVSQTVIVTRLEGRTPVPEREKLAALAAHRATMCIFLSVHMLDSVVDELTAGGYPADTPIAVVQKASWPDEKIYRGTLATIARTVEEAGVDRTAMIVVGRCLDGDYALSKLYSPDFGHMFREAK
ncbi:precorrin-4 C(11)-methyltransferase [Anaeroselena agilis]|uniref:Precorrin-4 C(11)-methyltransferase n=1 Tax=Anaeroselena agilis TaxID=3063788 RepID=A0ABU3NY73_9FIRM|nr:precorrin-4 C(11)-methyltransferase [Selenomonadales bacterium 4137-cl]